MKDCVAICIDNINPIEPIIALHEPYLPKGCDIYHLAKENINSIADYNKILVSKRLWRNLDFDRVIIIQHDSQLLRHGIEDYLQWEFCGAPIRWFQSPLLMNGGLSIRCPKAMLKVLNKIPYDGNAEDLFFCKALIQLGHEMPTVDEAMKFSVETMYYPTPIGLHAPEKYLTKEQCYNLRNKTV
jgi:hypothetical protein